MNVEFDFKNLVGNLNNLTQYSIGFLDGVKAAEPEILNNFGKSIIDSMKNFIDTNARIDPQILHHVYEWYQTGSPEARLFNLDYIIQGNDTLSFNYTFSQSMSYSKDSTTPFYDKANIMENGTPVIIRPKSAGVLSFQDGTEQVFTKKSIVVENPGGSGVQGGFEKTIKNFFDSYFTQSFLLSSGILDHFKDVKIYKENALAGSKEGKTLGFKIGYEWAAKGGKIVE
jgi:hypothetical protein